MGIMIYTTKQEENSKSGKPRNKHSNQTSKNKTHLRLQQNGSNSSRNPGWDHANEQKIVAMFVGENSACPELTTALLLPSLHKFCFLSI
jgi:hypothetical protein